jgi:PilZ domain
MDNTNDTAPEPPEEPRDKSKKQRVDSRRTFAEPLNARIISIDGTRSFQCKVSDISKTGAKLATFEAAKVPDTFFLALSSNGSTHRSCEIVWRTAKAVGVRFVAVVEPSP